MSGGACSAARGAFARAGGFTAAARGALLSFRSRFRTDDLVEVTLLACRRFVFINESEIALVELLKELLPRDWLKRILAGVARKVESQNAYILGRSRAFHMGRFCASLFRPVADCVVLSRYLGKIRH